MKLSIACRGRTASLVLGVPGALPVGDGYALSYAVDGGSPTTLAAVAAPNSTGAMDCLQWKCLRLPNACRLSIVHFRAEEVEHQVHCRTWYRPTCAPGPWRRSFEKSGRRDN